MSYHIMDPTYNEQKANLIGTTCVRTSSWNIWCDFDRASSL